MIVFPPKFSGKTQQQKKMELVQKIVAQKKFDRYVFITYENKKIVGLNFHQGLDEKDFESFNSPCKNLTEIFNEISTKKEAFNISEKKLINLSIKKYMKKYVLNR